MSATAIVTTQKHTPYWVQLLEALSGRTLTDEFESTDHYRMVETQFGGLSQTYTGSTQIFNGVRSQMVHQVAYDDPVDDGFIRVLPGGYVGVSR